MDLPEKSLGMKSGFPNQKVYRKVIGKSGNIWYYQPGPNAATTIYVSTKNKDGFGGSNVSFTLEDGTKDTAQGPWFTNSDAFFDDTGIDVRDTHPTTLSLSRNVEYGKGYYTRPKMLDVVHHEEEPVLGTFDRPKELAQEIANKTGEKLFYFIETYGGASSGWIEPENRG